ncbi:FkbM family methyltransferase [Breoghania sp. L-A4]|uniref:FkbM family methyltransferase n=1 Tax=Breoghania sp. L-A4 TaxID=2304600 RepID=UPI000E35C335|nr:FkbM family methyltransferase [Breoghania sp. L-A4]AXS42365.1 FkbM family methyltransferase [Breoghania sp. L-A4]
MPDTSSPFGTYRAEGLVHFAWKLADRHDLSAGLRKRLRGLVSRLFSGPYDTEIEGLRFRIYPAQNYDDRKMLSKGRLPEKAEHAMLAPYLDAGVTFVDVGANIGAYALFAAQRGARVLAVEANPATASKLAFNIAANASERPPGAIRLVESAAGEAESTLTLWHEPSNCGFATLVEDLTQGEWAGDWRPLEVAVRPLADLLADAGIDRPDVLKIDVEGFEDRVLLPYLRAREKAFWPRAVMLETNCQAHWAEDCLSFLEASGYRCVGETQDNGFFVLTD